MSALTPATARVYTALVQYKTLHQGNSPSLRELCALTGRGLASVKFHLAKLERAGLIVTRWPEARAIELPGAAWSPPGAIANP